MLSAHEVIVIGLRAAGPPQACVVLSGYDLGREFRHDPARDPVLQFENVLQRAVIGIRPEQ
jgi:hypothetical protein